MYPKNCSIGPFISGDYPGHSSLFYVNIGKSYLPSLILIATLFQFELKSCINSLSCIYKGSINSQLLKYSFTFGNTHWVNQLAVWLAFHFPVSGLKTLNDSVTIHILDEIVKLNFLLFGNFVAF
jgi:hypothetical protein